jgi:hypothetical protein
MYAEAKLDAASIAETVEAALSGVRARQPRRA